LCNDGQWVFSFSIFWASRGWARRACEKEDIKDGEEAEVRECLTPLNRAPQHTPHKPVAMQIFVKVTLKA